MRARERAKCTLPRGISAAIWTPVIGRKTNEGEQFMGRVLSPEELPEGLIITWVPFTWVGYYWSLIGECLLSSMRKG